MELLTAAPPWFLIGIEAALHFSLFLLVVASCLKTRREPASALLWIFLAWSFPLVGPILFLMFGINRMPRKVWRQQRASAAFLSRWRIRATLAPARPPGRRADLGAPHAAAFSLNQTLDPILRETPLLGGNAIELLVDGDAAYPRMLEAIRQARHHIHLQTFIVWNDAIGRAFLDLLAEKARQGVRVRFLFDSFGSTGAVLSPLFFRYRRVPNLRICGWAQAYRLQRVIQLNLRNHRKIMVVDGGRAFMGGINLRQENLSRPGVPAIRDYHVALCGPIVQDLQYSFLRDWHFTTDEDPDTLLQPDYFPDLEPAGSAWMRAVHSGPTADGVEVMAPVFFECLAAARRRVILVTPYFVPPADILRALCSAARRGVDVRLIVPQTNNHLYAGLAGQALYEDVMKAGVRVFERRAPFMHAKALIVDDTLAMVGSANLDVRSLRLNYESNVIVYDRAFIRDLAAMALREQANSRPLNLADWQARPQSRRLLENFCHLLTPVL